VTQQPGLSLAESIAAALEGRSRLLVFDNCEHVLDAAADMIETITARPSTIKVLATSREGLQLSDEHLWPVPSLDTTRSDSSAATLFVERAAGVAPGISLGSEDDADAVGEICRRLDGIPLAIELAASRMTSMTATEVRDHLHDRFRLLVGSRRALERHQTLRHAVHWSYDLLDISEKAMLARCSVFAGGFDLAGALAVAGSGDELATLDVLDALVRKSLVVADRSSVRTRFSMLETIRQFAEEQLVASGNGDTAREAHARYFARRETHVLTLWNGPRQREAYAWFSIELANLRAAFRYAADHGDLDTAATIATYATFLGMRVQQHEPIAWAEELIQPAHAVEHRLLPQLYLMAAQCYTSGRIDDAVRYAEAGIAAIDSFDQVPYDGEAWLGGVYLGKNQPERWAEVCRGTFRRSPGDHTFGRGALVVALTMTGAGSEAVAASEGLLTAADATDNPHVASYLLLAYAIAQHNTNSVVACDVHRRGLKIAHDSGNRELESYHAGNLARLVVIHGEPTDALDYVELALHMFYNSATFSLMTSALAVLAALLDRLGHYESAATISAAGTSPFTLTTFPEFKVTITHLREVLGDEVYESLARIGANMTNAAIAEYAFGQIDRARDELLRADESQ
jgi:predicted ATPase